MSCDHNWTVRFLSRDEGTIFEIRPITMNLQLSRDKYDFCRVKASVDVGKEMKPQTRWSGQYLYGYTKVQVCYNGDPIHNLLFRPDWVDYGDEYTHLQFHDLQKLLADGSIDEEQKTIHLKDIYTRVYEAADNDLLNGIDFSLAGQEIRTITGQSGTFTQVIPGGEMLEKIPGVGNRNVARRERRIAADDSKRMLESSSSISFNQITPEKALQRLNEMFHLKSWVNREGKLIIGLPEANKRHHVAAASDERVWRFKDPNISHGREPIKTILVEGSWVDEPGLEQIDELVGWFSDDGGGSDVKAIGVAERTDVDYGTRVTAKAKRAKKDALPIVSELALKEKMKQQNSGTVEIDPVLSGEEISSPIDLIPGDLLHLVPEDEYFDEITVDSGEVGDAVDYPDKVCGGVVDNEAYLTTGVTHNITEAGDWKIHVDLAMEPDVEIESYMSYFDPSSEDWVDSSEIDENGDLKGTGDVFNIGFESI